MGIVAYFTLSDRPETARWLTPRQLRIITAELEAERAAKAGHSRTSFSSALRDRRLYVLLGMSIGLIAGGAGIPLWLPTIIRQAGIINVWTIGLMAACPYIVAVVVQQLIARHSDRVQERRWHAALPAAVCGVGWILLAAFQQQSLGGPGHPDDYDGGLPGCDRPILDDARLVSVRFRGGGRHCLDHHCRRDRRLLCTNHRRLDRVTHRQPVLRSDLLRRDHDRRRHPSAAGHFADAGRWPSRCSV